MSIKEESIQPMNNLFRKEVLERRRHRLEGVVSLVQPAAFKMLTWLILALVLVSLTYLAVGKYTRKERASGVILPDTGLLKLKAPQTGIVTDLLVAEGQVVDKGDVILRILTERNGAGGEVNQAQVDRYRFELESIARQTADLRRQYGLEDEKLQAEKNNYQRRLEELRRQEETFTRRLALNEEIIGQIGQLKGTGYISELELTRQQDTLLALRQQASTIESERLSLDSQLAQLENRIQQLPIEHSRGIAGLENQKAQIEMQLAAARQEQLGELRAVQKGTVTGLLAKPGESVMQGQNLLGILPENSQMEAIIYLPARAIGLVEEGQRARLRYHAFPYEKFGIYQGSISQLSNNVILPEETAMPGIISEPSYRVVVSLDTQQVTAYGRQLPLRSGMTLDADIIVEERSLLHWLFDPIFSIQGRL